MLPSFLEDRSGTPGDESASVADDMSARCSPMKLANQRCGDTRLLDGTGIATR